MQDRNPWYVLGATVDCAGSEPDTPLRGTERGPDALRLAGIVESLGAYDEGNLDLRIERTKRHPTNGIIGFDSVCRMIDALRQRVEQIHSRGGCPLVLGGCCSVVPAAVAATRNFYGAPVGLAYVDGHSDLYTGRNSPTGEFADTPVSVMLGHEAPEELFGYNPPLLARDLVFLGHRDAKDAAARGSLIPGDVHPALDFDAARIRRVGPAQAGGRAAATFSEYPGGFWLALDWDVLCQTVFPAVDYLMEGGLDWTELFQLLEPLARAKNLRGVSIACYNPKKDPEGKCAAEIVKFLGALFGN
jgi:arginase